MQQIRQSVLTCLDKYKNEDRLVKELNLIVDKEGQQVYPVIFDVLTDLLMDPPEAEQCWHEIIEHYDRLSERLGRKVSLRTAICDYFCSIHKSLENPKVVEIHIFERTVKASRYDSLTGLFNRRYFLHRLKEEVARAERQRHHLSCMLLDHRSKMSKAI